MGRERLSQVRVAPGNLKLGGTRPPTHATSRRIPSALSGHVLLNVFAYGPPIARHRALRPPPQMAVTNETESVDYGEGRGRGEGGVDSGCRDTCPGRLPFKISCRRSTSAKKQRRGLQASNPVAEWSDHVAEVLTTTLGGNMASEVDEAPSAIADDEPHALRREL